MPVRAQENHCTEIFEYAEAAALYGHMVQARSGKTERAFAERLLALPLARNVPRSGAFAAPLADAFALARGAGDRTAAISGRHERSHRDLVTLIRQSGCLTRQEMLELTGSGARNALGIGDEASPSPRTIAPEADGDRTASRPILSVASVLVVAGIAAVIAAAVYTSRWMIRRGDARNARRFAVDMPVKLSFERSDETWDCVAEDISIAGLKLATPARAELGARIRVDVAGVVRPAVVRWSNQFYLGASFRAPLSKTDLSNILSSASKKPVPKREQRPERDAARSAT